MNRAERRREEREADKLGRNVANGFPAVRDTAQEIVSTEAVQDEIVQATRQATQVALRSILQSPGFVSAIREIVREAAIDCAKEILAEDMADLEERVRRIVSEHWEQSVSAAAHQVLSDALASIKRRLGVP